MNTEAGILIVAQALRLHSPSSWQAERLRYNNIANE
jgi:hypothetical protein